MSVATSILSPVSHRKGKVVEADVMYLDEIPVAMDRMGWRVSAALMRRWFSTKPAWAMPAHSRTAKVSSRSGVLSSRVDDKTVKMDWLLGFNRVLPVMEDLCSNWNNVNGRRELMRTLYEAGWTRGKTIRIGYGISSAKEIDDACTINFRPIGGYVDTLDDLSGSLFKANLKLAIVGETSSSRFHNKDTFEIKKIGVYVRDTYDFNALWLEETVIGLGIWNRNRCLTKAEMAAYKAAPMLERALKFPDFVPVKNSDFRRWQGARNEGADFYVFSDIMWMEPQVDYITIP
ncbi:DUF6402 family protein [Cupriavidus pauculus]|uniref:DUF6402 family protein n=1 Tax=Cupriavidus pauculus TaxID=82633 RepID=UPI001D0C90BD|nr:DUF6402 family protein [Cupriavidus pauculus]